MKNIKWNEDKNELLKKTRKISFEEFLEHIKNEDFRLLKNKNYPNQKNIFNIS